MEAEKDNTYINLCWIDRGGYYDPIVRFAVSCRGYASLLSFLKKSFLIKKTHVPDFFLFGMGKRQKFIYKDFFLK